MSLSDLPPRPTEPDGDDLPVLRGRPPGSRSRALLARLEAVECSAFATRRRARSEHAGRDLSPLIISRGRGANLWDADDNRYVDLAAGFGAVTLGHGASAIERAVAAQSDRLVQGLGDLYPSDAKIALLERVARLHPGASPCALLAATGGDAIEAALKTAVLVTGKPGVIGFEGGYHGLGHGPLAICGYRASYRAPFAAQLNPHASLVRYPHTEDDVETTLAAVREALSSGQVGCVVVEPVLGRGGIVVPPPGFLARLCELAREHGALIIADEVWTGIGRSGAMVRMTEEAAADILVFGKALGGGFPISACVAPAAIMDAWGRAEEVVHTSSHAGWPLACAAAIATVDTVRFKHLDVRAADVGGRFMGDLAARLAGAPGFVEVRGVGLMIGVVLDSAQPGLGLRALRGWLERGYLATTASADHSVLALTPPLTIAETQLEAAGIALGEVLHALARG